MKVIIKKAGEKPQISEIENNLSELQKVVGGFIETVTLCTDFCIICNEEGRLQGLPYNVAICGISFVGTIIGVGVAGDEFSDLNEKQIQFVIKMMEEK